MILYLSALVHIAWKRYIVNKCMQVLGLLLVRFPKPLASGVGKYISLGRRNPLTTTSRTLEVRPWVGSILPTTTYSICYIGLRSVCNCSNSKFIISIMAEIPDKKDTKANWHFSTEKRKNKTSQLWKRVFTLLQLVLSNARNSSSNINEQTYHSRTKLPNLSVKIRNLILFWE